MKRLVLPALLFAAAPAWAGHMMPAEKQSCIESPRVACVFDMAVDAVDDIEDPVDRVFALTEIADKQSQTGHGAKLGDIEGAKDTLAKAIYEALSIEEPFFRARALSAIADSFGKTENVAVARQMVEMALGAADKIEDLQLRGMALAEVATALARNGEIEAAKDVFGHGKRDVAPIETSFGVRTEYWQALALRAIGEAQAEAGDYDAAIATAMTISDANQRNLVLSWTAQLQNKFGHDLEAALETAKLVKDAFHRGRTYRDISHDSRDKRRDLEPAERLEAARRVVKIGLEFAKTVDLLSQRDRVYRDLVQAQADNGDFEEGMTTALMIEDEGLRSRAVRDVADAQAEAGEIAAAMAKLEKISIPSIRVWALKTAAKAQAESGDTAAAGTTMEKALEAARRLDSALWRARALGTVAEAYADIGDDARANAVMREAITVAGEIGGLYDRTRALGAIAHAQAEIGDLSGAVQTASTIEEAPLLRSKILTGFAEAKSFRWAGREDEKPE